MHTGLPWVWDCRDARAAGCTLAVGSLQGVGYHSGRAFLWTTCQTWQPAGRGPTHFSSGFQSPRGILGKLSLLSGGAPFAPGSSVASWTGGSIFSPIKPGTVAHRTAAAQIKRNERLCKHRAHTGRAVMVRDTIITDSDGHGVGAVHSGQ